MAGKSGPKVVTDGLVLYLDPANPDSYPGSGNTWYDISGRGNHFSLINSPTRVGNYFDFSTDEYATKAISANSGTTILTPDLVPTNQSFSIEVVYKFATDSSRTKFIGTGNYGSGGWNISVGYSNFNSIEFSAYNPDCVGVNCQYNRGNIAGNKTNNTTDFNFIQVVYDIEDTLSSLYVNGILLGTDDSSRVSGVGPNAPNFRIGLNMQGGWSSMKGYCGLVRFYNRALTSSEILSNYNSFADQYGI